MMVLYSSALAPSQNFWRRSAREVYSVQSLLLAPNPLHIILSKHGDLGESRLISEEVERKIFDCSEVYLCIYLQKYSPVHHANLL